jgi:large subunit ribosomal protein L16
MLQPKRVKYRKAHRGRLKGKAQRGDTLAFGDFGLQAQDRAWITARQIEAARRAIVHHFRRGGKVWIRVFPDKPVTKKPAETRMGSGKGNLDHWVAVVKPGRILFEASGISAEAAREAMHLGSHKLPIKVKFITRETISSSENKEEKLPVED